MRGASPVLALIAFALGMASPALADDIYIPLASRDVAAPRSPTATATVAPTATATACATATATVTATPTHTPIATSTRAPNATLPPTVTATSTASPTGTRPAVPTAAAARPRVRPVLFVPRDLDVYPSYPDSIEATLAEIQGWYARQLGRQSFEYDSLAVIRSQHDLAYFCPVEVGKA